MEVSLLTSVKCSGKLCSNTMKVFPYYEERRYFCSEYCKSDNNLVFVNRIIKDKKVNPNAGARRRLASEEIQERRSYLSDLMHETGMTTDDIAIKLGVNRSTISDYRNGRLNINDKKFEQIKAIKK